AAARQPGLVVQAVQRPQPAADPAVAVHREGTVVVRVSEQERPRRDQGGNRRPLPLIRVHQEHAVAVAVDDLVGDVALQVAHAADRHGTLHALVGGGDPERRRPAAGNAGHGDPVGIDVGPGAAVIDGPHSVPALDAGGRVAAGLPPPAAFAVRPVVDAGDLAELQRVDDEANVAVAAEPHAVVLEGRLVAVAATARVAAHVEHGRQL